MPLSNLIAFLGAAILLAVTPGPSTLVVLRQTLRSGRRTAFVTTLGNASGLMTWAMAAAFGLTALVAASQAAYDVIRILGAVVLAVLGIQSLLRARRGHGDDLAKEIASEAATWTSATPCSWQAYRTGLLTNLTNPKAAVFIVSFLPQFVPAHAPVLITILWLAAMHSVISISWYNVLAWMVSRARQEFVRPSVRRRLEQVSGLVLLGFSVRLAVEHR
ncbi:MAG TPA: LysE family translocator [Ktedonobacterales bacterium]|nr:LysE family translocator [Ktedonobacterales bacterium]